MAKFEQFVDLFTDPEKFQRKIQEYKELMKQAKESLDKVKVWNEVQEAHGRIATLSSNAQTKYRLAEQALAEARSKGEDLIEEAMETIKDVRKVTRLKEESVAQREIEASAKEQALDLAASFNESVKSKLAARERELMDKLVSADNKSRDLDQKLVQVNKLLSP